MDDKRETDSICEALKFHNGGGRKREKVKERDEKVGSESVEEAFTA